MIPALLPAPTIEGRPAEVGPSSDDGVFADVFGSVLHGAHDHAPPAEDPETAGEPAAHPMAETAAPTAEGEPVANASIDSDADDPTERGDREDGAPAHTVSLPEPAAARAVAATGSAGDRADAARPAAAERGPASIPASPRVASTPAATVSARADQLVAAAGAGTPPSAPDAVMDASVPSPTVSPIDADVVSPTAMTTASTVELESSGASAIEGEAPAADPTDSAPAASTDVEPADTAHTIDAELTTGAEAITDLETTSEPADVSDVDLAATDDPSDDLADASLDIEADVVVETADRPGDVDTPTEADDAPRREEPVRRGDGRADHAATRATPAERAVPAEPVTTSGRATPATPATPANPAASTDGSAATTSAPAPNTPTTAAPDADIVVPTATASTVAEAAPSPAPQPVAAMPTVAPSAPSAPVAPTAPPAPAPPVPQQIVQHVTPLVLRGDGVHEITIELDPVDLGRLRLEIVVDDGVVNVRVHADDPGARRLIADQLHDLRNALRDAGLTSGELDVRDGGARAERDDTHREPNRNRTTGRGQATDPDHRSTTPRPAVSSSASLDVLL